MKYLFTLLFISISVFAEPPGRNWKQVWQDEFNGSKLDKRKWSIGQEWTQQKCAYPNQDKIDNKTLVEVKDGKLKIYVHQAPAQGKKYSGGLIKSRQHGKSSKKPMFSFKYGYIEAKIKYDLPGKGRHANFFTYGYDKENGKNSIGYHFWPPEIDIAEVVSYGVNKDIYHQYLVDYHYAFVDGKKVDEKSNIKKKWNKSWHTFGAEWKKDGKVDFYCDGKRVYSTKATNAKTKYDIEQYILFRVGTGGSGWGGDPDQNTDAKNWPASMEVDWVRVWQKK